MSIWLEQQGVSYVEEAQGSRDIEVQGSQDIVETIEVQGGQLRRYPARQRKPTAKAAGY